MKWKGRDRSSNVEDRRGSGGIGMAGKGALGGGLGIMDNYLSGIWAHVS